MFAACLSLPGAIRGQITLPTPCLPALGSCLHLFRPPFSALPARAVLPTAVRGQLGEEPGLGAGPWFLAPVAGAASLMGSLLQTLDAGLGPRARSRD